MAINQRTDPADYQKETSSIFWRCGIVLNEDDPFSKLSEQEVVVLKSMIQLQLSLTYLAGVKDGMNIKPYKEE